MHDPGNHGIAVARRSMKWWLKSALVFCVSAAAVYAIALIASSIFNPIRVYDPNTTTYYDKKNLIMEFDPEFGFINRRNYSFIRTARVEPRDIEFGVYHDRHGYRVNGPTEVARRDVDVLFCGESSASGFGMENEDTIGPQLETMADIKVLNVSIIGGTGGSCLAQLMRAASLGSARFAVYYFWQEHLSSNRAPCATTPTPVCLPLNHVRKAGDGSLYIDWVNAEEARGYDRITRFYLEARADNNSQGTLFTDIYWKHHAWMRSLQDFISKYTYQPPEEREASAFLIREMKDRLRNITLIVMYVPYYFDGKIAETPKWLQPTLNQAGIPSFSLEQAFREAVNDKRTFWFSDGHLNPDGHRLIGQALANWGAKAGYWRLRDQ